MKPTDYLDTAAAAAYLGKSVRAFERLRDRLRQRGFWIDEYRIGRLLRYRPEDLDALVRKMPKPSRKSLLLRRVAR